MWPTPLSRRLLLRGLVGAVLAWSTAADKPAHAETFLLKSGERVNGTLQEEFRTPDRKRWLRIQTDFGTVSIPKAALKKKLATRRTGGPLRVESIVVTTLKGDVEKLRPEAEGWTRLSPRAKDTSSDSTARSNVPNGVLAPGEQLPTGPDGEADLDIGWGVVHVAPSSHIEFLTSGNATLSMTRGAAGARLDKLPSDAEFRVETPQTSMGVRGTTFSVRVGTATRVAVEEGVVAVGPLDVSAGAAATQTVDAEPVATAPDAGDREIFERLRRTYALPRLEKVLLPAGEFEFGDDGTAGDIEPDRTPGRVEVEMTSFRIGRTEVTNAHFRIFREFIADHRDHTWCHPSEPPNHPHTAFGAEPYTGADQGLFQGDDQPVAGVDWFTAYAFAAWVGGRLPSQVEWEYAARGGATSAYPWGGQGKAGEVFEHAWVQENCGDEPPMYAAPSSFGTDEEKMAAEKREQVRVRLRTHPVATLKPNGFGLYDMLGNVAEYSDGVWPARAGVQPADGSERGSPWPDTDAGRAPRTHGGNILYLGADLGASSTDPAVRRAPGALVGVRVAW